MSSKRPLILLSVFVLTISLAAAATTAYGGPSRPPAATKATPSGSVATDRAVLTTLYNATDGDNWTDNTNWLSDKPLADWYGVANDDDGRVTGLFLNENQLTGKIPPELSNLASLEELVLWGNQLSGKIPAELANLKKLEHLN